MPIRGKLDIKSGQIDYAIFTPESGKDLFLVILLVCGWSSGWTGIRLLAIFLSVLGYTVVVPSVPGYGDSFTPPRDKWSKDGFEKEAEWLSEFWKKLSEENSWGDNLFFVGHSTGCQIGVEMAARHLIDIKRMVLLSPSGLKEISGFWAKSYFAIRFFWSAYQHDRKFKEKENDFLIGCWDQSYQKEAGPFWPWLRLRQRLDEFRRLCQGSIRKAIWNGDSSSLNTSLLGTKILVMTGTNDSVFGPTIERLSVSLREAFIEILVIDGGYHNLTKLLADKVGEKISEFLRN